MEFDAAPTATASAPGTAAARAFGVVEWLSPRASGRQTPWDAVHPESALRRREPEDSAKIEAQPKDSVHGDIDRTNQSRPRSPCRHETEAESRLHDEPGRYEERDRKHQRGNQSRPRAKAELHDREIKRCVSDSHDIVEGPTNRDLAWDLRCGGKRPGDKNPPPKTRRPTPHQAPRFRPDSQPPHRAPPASPHLR